MTMKCVGENGWFKDVDDGREHLKDVTNIEIQSPTFTKRHNVTNITVT